MTEKPEWLNFPEDAEPEDVMLRLCTLQEIVCDRVLGFDNPNDCFCRQGGFHVDGKRKGRKDGWRSDGSAVKYIFDSTVSMALAGIRDPEAWRAAVERVVTAARLIDFHRSSIYYRAETGGLLTTLAELDRLEQGAANEAKEE